MTTEIKKINDSFIEVDVISPIDEVNKNKEILYNKYQKTIEINGFRRGKVPLNIIKARYENVINQEAINMVINDAYKRVIKENNLFPVTQAQAKDVKIDENNLSFKLFFEIIPQIEIKNYKGIEVKVRKMSTLIDEQLKKLQESKAIYTPVYLRRSGPSDMVLVDYEILYEEKGVYRCESVNNYAIVLNKGKIDEEIFNSLIDCGIGESKKVKVRYSLDYPDKKLSGKLVEYRFIIREIKEKKLPKIDDEFAKILGFNSLDELKEFIKKTIENLPEYRGAIETQIINYLIKENEFTPPPSFVSAFFRSLIKELNESNEKITDEVKNELEKIAIWKANRFVILKKLCEQENIRLSEEEIKEKFMSLKEVKEKGYETVIKELKKKNEYDLIIEQFLQEKVVDFLIKNAKIIEE